MAAEINKFQVKFAEDAEPKNRKYNARKMLEVEAESLYKVSERLDDSFDRAIELLLACKGRVAVTGIGKSGDIAQKIVGTLNSTGTRSYFFDAVKALHGDLGMLHPDDVVFIFSHSGESDELIRLLNPLREISGKILGVTSNANSSLARSSNVAIIYGTVMESCPLALAPSTSATVMMAIGHALAFVLSTEKNFTREDFARFHPAGSLGKRLAKVEQIMRKGDQLRIAQESTTIREVFINAHRSGRRTGAIILVDSEKKLSGIFTDSDFARLFEDRDDHLDRPIGQVMTRLPIYCLEGNTIESALEIFQTKKISELPVVNKLLEPIGILDITDVIGLLSILDKGVNSSTLISSNPGLNTFSDQLPSEVQSGFKVVADSRLDILNPEELSRKRSA